MGALERKLTRNAGVRSAKKKPHHTKDGGGKERASAKAHTLDVAELRPAHGALRPHVRPSLQQTQNGSPTHNLAKKSALGR